MAKNKKLKKRWTAGFLAVLAAFLAIAWQPLEIRAEEVAQSDETVLLEGIEMDKTNLVMKTGEQKTLRATLLPENTTEQPEIQWSSDDTDVVEVEGSGNEAVVRAPDGPGGTAIITVTAGNFTATCKVLVIVQDPLLESIVFMQNSSGSNRYELTEGLPGSNEFTPVSYTHLMGVEALRIISVGFVVSTIGAVLAGAFEALGRGIPSLAITLTRQLIIILPLSALLSKSLGLAGVWMTFPVAECAGTILAVSLWKWKKI